MTKRVNMYINREETISSQNDGLCNRSSDRCNLVSVITVLK